MPLYEFKCDSCGGKFSKLTTETECVCDCGGTAHKVFSTFSFKFVGYPSWVQKLDDHQKRQVARGEEPTLLSRKNLAKM